MNCLEFRRTHLEFCEGQLSADAESAAHTHLDECPDCARFDCRVRRGLLVVRNLPPVMPRAGTYARVMAGVAADTERMRNRRALLLTCAAAAASIAIVAAALTLGGVRAPAAVAPPPSTGIAAASRVARPAWREPWLPARDAMLPVVALPASTTVHFADVENPPFAARR